VSTSSSSFASSPPELSYDVACLERKRSKPAPNAVKLTEIPSEATKLLSPVLNRKFRRYFFSLVPDAFLQLIFNNNS